MITALIRKDYRLLRIYVRTSIVATIACYFVTGVFAVWTTHYMDIAAQRPLARLLMTLAGASYIGMLLTLFLSALLAGSVFTLERSDRSAEFLACLPPSRWQNLISKLTVVFLIILTHLIVHLSAALAVQSLLPYQRLQMVHFDIRAYWVVTPVVALVTGFALAASSLLRSNGVPALLGLLSPIFSISVAKLLGWLMDVPSEGNSFAVRYATTSVVLGVVSTICAGYWYVSRSEP